MKRPVNLQTHNNQDNVKQKLKSRDNKDFTNVLQHVYVIPVVSVTDKKDNYCKTNVICVNTKKNIQKPVYD
jgi:hypothetical protein